MLINKYHITYMTRGYKSKADLDAALVIQDLMLNVNYLVYKELLF